MVRYRGPRHPWPLPVNKNVHFVLTVIIINNYPGERPRGLSAGPLAPTNYAQMR